MTTLSKTIPVPSADFIPASTEAVTADTSPVMVTKDLPPIPVPSRILNITGTFTPLVRIEETMVPD